MKTTEHAEIFAGDDVNLDIQLLDGADVAIDITGFTLKWILAQHIGSAALITKLNDSTNGITITDAVNGKFRVIVDAADTKDLAGTFTHEAEATDAGGKVVTITRGYILISKSSS